MSDTNYRVDLPAQGEPLTEKDAQDILAASPAGVTSITLVAPSGVRAESSFTKALAAAVELDKNLSISIVSAPPALASQIRSAAKGNSRLTASTTKAAPRPVGTTNKKKAGKQASSHNSLIAAVVIGLVVLFAIGIGVVAILSPNSTSSQKDAAGFSAAPSSLTKSLTSIPTSVYNTVGVTSPAATVTPPRPITAPPLTTSSGKPLVMYAGAEYCPYCAAQRWPLIAALSRFGSVSSLGLTSSGSADVYPNTPSFTFLKVGYFSNYIGLSTVELETNVISSAGGYTKLQTPSKQQQSIMSKYNTQNYTGQAAGSIPFLNIGNKYVQAGSSYSPQILSGLTRAEIASGLSDPTNPATAAIVTSANYISAAICATTNNAPANVCLTPGVRAAAASMSHG